MKSLWTRSCMVAWDLACSSFAECKDVLPIHDVVCSLVGDQEQKEEPRSCDCVVMKLLIYCAATSSSANACRAEFISQLH